MGRALERVEALTQAVLARREGREHEPADAMLERVRAERQDGRQKSAGRARRPAGQTALPGE